MSDIPEWAMQNAREIVAAILEEDGVIALDIREVLSGSVDELYGIKIIARALMAAADAATERAASWHDNQAVEIEMSSKRVNGKMMTRKPLWHRQCAAAIRKGTE